LPPVQKKHSPSIEETLSAWVNHLSIALPLVALLLTPFALYSIYRAPIEALQGLPQKIFYLHVPLAWCAFILFGGVALNSVLYLLRRNPFWDQVARGCAEGGFLALTGVLVTGPIWAKPIWGTFWVWEPRLTTTFILWVIYLGYHLFRYLRGNDGFTARASSVLGILAFADIPVIHLSVLWWRSLHPLPVVLRKGDLGGGLAPGMGSALLMMFLCLFALTLGLSFLSARLHTLEDLFKRRNLWQTA